VKTIDPKGKWKKCENDSLGNLAKVTEPFPGPGTGADYVTTYAYSMFGKLTTVTMPRPNKANSSTETQARTFSYSRAKRRQSFFLRCRFFGFPPDQYRITPRILQRTFQNLARMLVKNRRPGSDSVTRKFTRSKHLISLLF